MEITASIFPKEMLLATDLFSKQVEEFTSYISNDYFTGKKDSKEPL